MNRRSVETFLNEPAIPRTEKHKERNRYMALWRESRGLYSFFGMVTVCLFVSVLSTRPVEAQTFEEWVKEVKEQTNELDDVKVTINMSSSDKASSRQEYQTHISMRKRGAVFHYQMGDIEIVNDGQYQLTANHDFRTISLFKIMDASQKVNPEMMSLDSILGYYSNPVKVSEDDQQVQYRVSQHNSLVKELLVSINKQKKQIERIAYDYELGAGGGSNAMQKHVEMTFDIRPLSTDDDRYFDVDRFIRQGNGPGDVSLADTFQGYYLEKLN